MADKSWTSLETFGSSILTYEGEATATKLALLKTFANQWVDVLNSQIEQVYRSWNNVAVTGTITLTTNTFNLPTDCLMAVDVKWNGESLTETDEAWLDAVSDTWRTDTGTPSSFVRVGRAIILDCIPSGTTTGMLTVWGWGCLPYFTTGEGAENPLASIPMPYQDLPVFYALKMMPADPQSVLQTGRKAEYSALYDTLMPQCVDQLSARSKELFTF
jgi:hypothetical protein